MRGRKGDGGACAMRRRGNQAAYVADRGRRLKAPEPALGKLHIPIALQGYFRKTITRNRQTRYIQLQENAMNLVIRDLPAGVWENLNKKAKGSGRSIEAEAAAILAACLEDTDLMPVDDMDDLQRMVWEAYGGKLPGNAVDELLAERRLEAKAEAEKLG
jgi:hypothetical protein